MVRKYATAVLFVLLTLALSVGIRAEEDKAPRREAPKAAKKAEKASAEYKTRKDKFTDDAYKWVYFSSAKDKEGSWDLGKKGVEHVHFGTSAFVLDLLPDGESDNYYWVKENLTTGAWHWAFAKKAQDGGYGILYSTDGMNYYEWDPKGKRGQRYPVSN